MCIDIVEKFFFCVCVWGGGGGGRGEGLLMGTFSQFLQLSARHRVMAGYFVFMLLLFQRKYNGISCDSSARQTIHMKCLVLFSLTVVCCSCA